ncbi:MAG TPA: hypothetical protein VF883_22095 [Thermoanaerobaculia bacterium]|jgi:serine/threonine protein kinase
MADSTRAVGSSGLGPGTVLDGKYEILLRIGAGGMGEVFKARHLHLEAFRCIKVMNRSCSPTTRSARGSAGGRHRIDAEIRLQF